jgi:Mg/Co/Ni transporter MgtE
VRLSTTSVNLRPFHRRGGEILLAADVLGRSVINVGTARLVRARDIGLVRRGPSWLVAGVDTSFAALLRHLYPRRWRMGPATDDDQLVAWSDIEPFMGHIASPRLRLAHRKLARLHPAQLADLVEAASPAQGEEILEAVATDAELQADVVEELDDHHRVESLRGYSDSQVAALFAKLPSDDVADLLLELDQSRRVHVLTLLPARLRRTVRALLAYNPQTAGGIMNPDLVAVSDDATAADAIAAVRASPVPSKDVYCIYVTNADDRLTGTVRLADLIRAADGESVAVLQHATPTTTADTDVPEIAQLMADYDLLALPVTDSDGRILGVLALDDLLERLLPDAWRRRHGSARD